MMGERRVQETGLACQENHGLRQNRPERSCSKTPFCFQEKFRRKKLKNPCKILSEVFNKFAITEKYFITILFKAVL